MKTKLTFILTIAFAINSYSFAQISEKGTPPSFQVASIPMYRDEIREFPKPDTEKIMLEDTEDGKNGVVKKVAIGIPVNLNIENSGNWTILPDGGRIWRLKLKSLDALALGVYYDKFWLPPGGKLYLYNEDKTQIIGAFTEFNNHETGLFATELIQGETVTLEYFEPDFPSGNAIISISEIAYAYRDVNFVLKGGAKDFGDSDICEININCSPEGNDWQDEKRGVARILIKIGVYYGWCTGSLINNVNQDCTPYLLTADHCGEGASATDLNQWVFYFNYEAPACFNPGSEPSFNSMTGATFIANGGDGGNTGSDFYLVLLNNIVPEAYNPYFNGWNRINSPSSSGVSIHHPSGDIKKISTYATSLVSASCGGPPDTHWLVIWEPTTNGHGVTEGGSSGSPIFDNNGRIVGTLTGGASYCSTPTDPDFYGKFSYHWQSNGTADSERLQPWLDPYNTGVTTINGIYSPCEGPEANNISGRIFNDLNADCIQDFNEDGLQYWLVQAAPGPYYAITNSDGFYSFLVDTGIYYVSLILPNSLWQQNCPVSPNYYVVDIISSTDTISNINFGVQADFYCPDLSVDISTWAVRPCFQSTYSVNYCNNGTIEVTNSTIEVELNDNMTYTGGNGNLISQIGNILTFDVGTLNLSQCGSFYLYVDVLCDMSLVGQTMCVEAHIYPDSLCFPADSTWDHSSVAVEGGCVGDSLACFTIYNTGDPGTGDMAGTSEYRIYENNILVYTGTFQINGGDNLVICWSANGNTIRLEADQRPGHPGNSHPQDNVEMCGDSLFVTGQITVIPEDDEDDFVEIDCHVAIGSYDPNDKQVKPEGLTETYHFIDSTDVLEYVIHFQNTGTDTAFNVVIYDTLSTYLDITTIEPGASSHPYALNIIGSNILQWTFENILLPDSNVNEPASNGFVKFKIHQMPGNNIGTIIENNSGIIFDFNEPVITNMVFNTIGNIDSIVTNVPIIYDKDISVKVYPNPFNSTTTFEIEGMNQPVTFKLYNIIGKQVKAISDITGKKFIISRENLSNGIYIYKISSKDKLICAGKLVVN